MRTTPPPLLVWRNFVGLPLVSVTLLGALAREPYSGNNTHAGLGLEEFSERHHHHY